MLPIAPISVDNLCVFSSFRLIRRGCSTLSEDTLLVVGKEVVIEDDGDAQEQLRVYGRPPENLVDVGAVAIKFAGEPADGSLLVFKFLLDELSDVQT